MWAAFNAIAAGLVYGRRCTTRTDQVQRSFKDTSPKQQHERVIASALPISRADAARTRQLTPVHIGVVADSSPANACATRSHGDTRSRSPCHLVAPRRRQAELTGPPGSDEYKLRNDEPG
jgi:hypothetical protein